jgi:hypothetical protein
MISNKELIELANSLNIDEEISIRKNGIKRVMLTFSDGVLTRREVVDMEFIATINIENFLHWVIEKSREVMNRERNKP